MTDEVAKLGLEVDSRGFVRAKRDLDQFNVTADRTDRQAKKLTGSMKRLGQRVGRVGSVAGLALAGIAANSVRLASTFESELTKINTLVGISRDQIDGYRDAILNLSPAVGRGPTELARAMFAITSAGARGQQALDILEASSKAAAIGLGDTRDIALAAGAAVTAYGEDTLNASQAVDIMIGTIEQGNLEASQLAGVLGRVLGLAAQAGVSFQDAGAFIASFTRQGVDAAQAVTGLRGALTLLVREPTKRTTEAFEEMGWSIDGLKQAVEERGFISAFQEMVDRAEAAGVSMGNVIPEVEALAGVMAVFASEGESAASIADSVGEAVGTLDERFREAVENDPALAFQMVRAEMETLQTRIGQDLLPTWVTLLRALSGTEDQVGPLRQGFMLMGSVILNVAQGALLVAGGFNEVRRAAARTENTIQEFWINVMRTLDAADIRNDAAGLGLDPEETQRLLDQNTMMWDAYARQTLETNDEIDARINETQDTIFGLVAAIDEAKEAHERQTDAVKNGKRELDRLESEIRAVGSAAGESSGEIDTLTGSVDELFASERDFQRMNEELAAQLQGPMAEAMLEYQRKREEVIEANNNLEVTFETMQQRLALLRQEFELTGDAIARDMIAQLERMSGLDLSEMFAGMFGLGGGGFSLGDAVSQIGSNFAQSIINGQSIRRSLSSAFTSYGGNVLGDSAGKFFEDVASDGLAAAFENSKTREGMAGGFAMALGQALEGNYVQGAATALGTAIGGPIGGMIGSIIGSLIGGKSDPNFQIRGSSFRGSEFQNIGTDARITTALGSTDFGFRYIEAGVQSQVMNALESMDATIAAALRGGPLLDQAADAAAGWAGSAREFGEDTEALLEDRLRAIVGAIGGAVEQFVMDANSLEGQLANLQAAMTINRALLSGRTLGLSGMATAPGNVGPIFGGGGGPGTGGPDTGPPRGDFRDIHAGSFTEFAQDAMRAIASVGEGMDIATAQIDGTADAAGGLHPELAATIEVLAEVRIGSEALSDTFQRVADTMSALDLAAAVMGAQFGETRREAILFGAELVAMFGDDAGQLASSMNRIFEAFYTEAEVAEAQAAQAGERATRLLTELTSEIGMTFDASMLTAEGFRALFEELMRNGELTAAQTAVLINAGNAVADMIDFENELAETRTNNAQAARDLQAELDDVMFTEFTSQFRQQAAAIRQDSADWIRRAEEIGMAEQFLGQIRAIETLRMNQLAGALRQSITGIIDALNGGGAVGTATSGAMQSIGQIAEANQSRYDEELRALERIRDYVDSFLTSDLSPLTPGERVNEARSQLLDALNAAESGDVDAIEAIPQLADTFFRLLQDFTGGVGEYPPEVMALIERIEAIGNQEPQQLPPTQRPPSAFEVSGGFQTVTNALDGVARLQQIATLIDELALLADITGESPFEIAQELDAPIMDIIEALTGEVPNLTGEALEQYFNNVVTAAYSTPAELGLLVQYGSDHLAEAWRQTQVLNEIAVLLGGTGVGGHEGDTFFPPPPPAGPQPPEPPGIQSTGSDAAVLDRLERIEDRLAEGNRDRVAGNNRVREGVERVATTMARSAREAEQRSFAMSSTRGGR